MKQICYAALFLLSCAAFGQVTITDATINAGETVTLTSDTEYILDGFVYVEAGATLVIEAGTVIKAKQTPTTGDNASALIIARNGRIEANGTAAAPIIMTSEFDDINDPADLIWSDRGFWGGLIILGNGEVNKGEAAIEGIPSGEERALYGGNDNTDDSGVIRYVSVRHGGAELGPGDEINGVTFGAVGSGTTVEYVEVFANLDDGFEWFGGAVNTKYLVAAFCADDSFDWDAGWIANNQFWFALQGTDQGGRIAEMDGTTVADGTFSNPVVYNASYVGAGLDATPDGDGSEAMIIRDTSGGSYINSIITEYNAFGGGAGVVVEDEDGLDSRQRLEDGFVTLASNIWWNFGDGNTLEAIAPQDFVQAHLGANDNQIVDPMLRGLSRVPDKGLDPRPAAGSPAVSGAVAPTDSFFTTTAYYGAFDPNGTAWIDGWTALSDEGHLVDADPVAKTDRFVNHVTATTSDFATTISMVNPGDSVESVTLIPCDAAGNQMTATTYQVGAASTLSVLSTDAFPGLEVSHFSVSASDQVRVVAGFKVTTTTGATAHVNETNTTHTSVNFIPGEQDVVFDGMALVNHGDAAATVTLTAYDAAGNVVSTTEASNNLAPGAKLLVNFDTIDLTGVVRVSIASTQASGIVMLRGTRAGSDTAILYQVNPIPGN